MNIERSYNIRDEAGRIICPDFECLIDCELEWDNGVPVVRVDDVLARDWRSPFNKPEYISLLIDPDPAFSLILERIIERAENDESILEDLIDEDCESRSWAAA